MALVEGCKHSIEIIVPVADVEKETERVVANIRSKVRLPGFRPGKAPENIVKSRFAEDIRQDVLEALAPRFFKQAVEKEHLEVVGSPSMSDVHFHVGEPLRFKANFEVAPQIELGEYRGVEINYSEPEVADSDVEERLNHVRDQKAEYVNEDPRPLADGDYAVIALESLSGVAEKISQDEMMVQIGGQTTMKEFSENLRGVSPEESPEFEVTYPEDYERSNLAGRTVRFRATVKAVRRKELPELNDEFAKDLGDFQTLDELKEAIRKSIFREREVRAQERAKNQLLDKLVAAHDFPVPETYVDRQIEMNVENRVRQLAAQGVDPSKIKLDWQKVREAQKDQAARDVKASLLLDKIAERETIHATQEDVDREVQRIARQRKESVALVRPKLQKDGTLARIANHIRTEKTLTMLFEQARKVAAPAEEAELSAEAEPPAEAES